MLIDLVEEREEVLAVHVAFAVLGILVYLELDLLASDDRPARLVIRMVRGATAVEVTVAVLAIAVALSRLSSLIAAVCVVLVVASPPDMLA